MIDSEVQRLRRLRGSALKLRAVARALGQQRCNGGDRAFQLAACAAWRVVRMVSGRLRAHPHERYQQDAGIGTLLQSGVTAAVAALTTSSRHRAMVACAARLRAVMRELDDARALTWAADFSDQLGRSQREIRLLLDAVDQETGQGAATASISRGRHAGNAVGDQSRFLTI